MRIGFLARLGAAALGVSALGACGFLPPSSTPDFTVAGAVAAQPDVFRNADPNVNDVVAKLYCAEGYQRLDEMSLPAEPGSFTVWRVQCTPYETPWAFLPNF
jgi:hypothetical protein